MKSIIFNIFKNIAQVLKGTGVGKIPYMMNIYQYLVSHFSPKKVTIDSIVYSLDSQDSLGLSMFGVNDETQVKLIKQEIKKNWVVVDVGAHIGYYTLMYASLVGNKGKVYAFEPAKNTYKILKANIQNNKFTNIMAENLAVSNEKKIIKFFESDNPLTNRIVNKYTSEHDNAIQAICLDDYFKNTNEKINFIKIDVEGAEYLVLQGMQSVLKKNKDIKLFIEFCPVHLKEYDVNAEDMLEFLEKFGFSFFEVSDKNKTIKAISKKKLLFNYQSGITNIFCTRS